MKKKLIIFSLSSLITYSLLFYAAVYYFERMITLQHRIDEMIFAHLSANSIENKFEIYNRFLNPNQASEEEYDKLLTLEKTFSFKNKKIQQISELTSKDLFNSIKLISDEHKDLFLETGKTIENLHENLAVLNKFIETESSEFSKETDIHLKYLSLKPVIKNQSILILKKNEFHVKATVIYQDKSIYNNSTNSNELFFIINSNHEIVHENGFSNSIDLYRKMARNISREIDDIGIIQLQREINGMLYQIRSIKKFGIYYVEAKKLNIFNEEIKRVKNILTIFFVFAFLLSETILLVVFSRKQPSA